MKHRRLLAALGIAAASIVTGTAATVGYGLATGFDRAADEADLPHVIARFDQESRETVDARVRALPNVVDRSYRLEFRNQRVRSRGDSTRKATIDVLLGGRRGYAVVEGRDLREQGEVVIERGLATDWELEPGDRVVIDDFAARVVGVAVEPSNVAFPLTVTPRLYLLPWEDGLPANVAQLWLADPDRADITLAQARATSFGVGNLTFVTRAGIQVLLGQAAGIVISLLVAFSLVALVAAGTMLAAGAQADVARRLPAFGVQRALGFTPARLAAAQALESLRWPGRRPRPGWRRGRSRWRAPRPTSSRSSTSSRPDGRWCRCWLLAWLAVVALVVVAGTWPAWRAARRPPAAVLRRGDAPRRVRAGAPGSLLALGARLATAARGRYAAAVAVLAVCVGVLTLMLALASLLERLRDDPGTIGKRYQLTVRVDPLLEPDVAAIPGVADVAPRYEVEVADSFRLGEPLRLVAFPGDHTPFEAPPLAEGRRLRGPGEAEVGLGLADALGLRPGATLAVQLEGAGEVRFRVVGVVRALERDGRIAYVQPDRLLAANPALGGGSLAVKLEPGADRAAVEADLAALGAPPQPVAAATTRNAGFLGVLAAVLRGVGLAIGLVCLYALVQALAMTARERRGAVALLRAAGGDARTVGLLLAGAALAVAVPAAVFGLLLEWLLLAPLVARLAAGYAALPLAPSAGQAAIVAAAVLLLAAAATWLVAAAPPASRSSAG